jgi:predicted DNA-binding protein
VDKMKYKSVAVPIETYQKLQKLAKDGDRSVARQIAHMVKSYTLESEKAA